MKTIYKLLAIILLCNFNSPTQAQNDESSTWEGAQSTFNEMVNDGIDDFKINFDNSIKKTELGRLYKLYNSDVRMWMEAKSKDTTITISKELDLYYDEAGSKGSIYAEFDWDNKAQSMHITDSKSADGIRQKIGTIAIIDNEAQDQMQYTDKEGYYYVPAGEPDKVTKKQDFYKVNMKKTALKALKALKDLSISDETKMTAYQLIGLAKRLNLTVMSEDPNSLYFLFMALKNNEPGIYTILETDGAIANNEFQKELEKAIEKIKNEQYSQIVGFPVFIHWAFRYSPAYLKTYYGTKLTETEITFRGVPDHTKLTVTKGKDKGNYMIFDPYYRLVFIKSDDGTVKYAYDKDVTVNLPPAWDYGNLMNGILESQKPEEPKSKN